MTRRGTLTDEEIAACLEHTGANLREFIVSPPNDDDLWVSNVEDVEWLLKEAANRIRLLAGREPEEPESPVEPFPSASIPVELEGTRECHFELSPDELKP